MAEAEELDLGLFTYTAPTLAEALEIAKQKHGENAMIAHSREVKKKSLLENGLYEVVIVDRKEKNAPKSPNSQNANPQNPQNVNFGANLQGNKADDKPDNDIAKRLDKIAQKELAKRRLEKIAREQEINAEISSAVREISKIALGGEKETFELADENDNGREGNLRESSNESNHKSNKDSRESSKNAQDSRQNAIDSQDLAQDSSDFTRFNPIAQTREMLAKLNSDEIKELQTIKSSLNRLDDKMKLLQNMFWSDIGVRAQSSNIPQEFAEIYRICKNSGMKNEHLEEIMRLSSEHMPIKLRANSVMTKRYFREVLRKLIPCRVENIDMTKKRIIMIVGPTGVGKTTTIAKLATHYSTKHNYKVGIISLDGYRIGAFEQLAFYAKKLKVSINKVDNTTEFEQSLEDMKYCDYILIDTIGSSQNDKQKLDFLRKFANTDYNIDVNLMLSATTKFEDLRDIYGAFSILNIDTLIFSKLDESKGFGNVFSLIYDTKKPVSYLTVGQEVPEDILVAKNDYIADYIINGFSKPNRSAIIRAPL